MSIDLLYVTTMILWLKRFDEFSLHLIKMLCVHKMLFSIPRDMGKCIDGSNLEFENISRDKINECNFDVVKIKSSYEVNNNGTSKGR